MDVSPTTAPCDFPPGEAGGPPAHREGPHRERLDDGLPAMPGPIGSASSGPSPEAAGRRRAQKTRTGSKRSAAISSTVMPMKATATP